MDGFGDAIASGIVAVIVLAFVAGAALMGGLVWLWPHLPSITVTW